jgi:hypothetical protein
MGDIGCIAARRGAHLVRPGVATIGLVSHESNHDLGPGREDEQQAVSGFAERSKDHRWPKDPLLATLVDLVDRSPFFDPQQPPSSGLEIGVTLDVNGVVISGMLCSLRSYLEDQANFLRSQGSTESAPIGEALSGLFSKIAEQVKPELQDESSTEISTNFIHLREATVHAPGTDGYLLQPFWRGRLDHVSGWSIGNYGHKPLRMI